MLHCHNKGTWFPCVIVSLSNTQSRVFKNPKLSWQQWQNQPHILNKIHNLCHNLTLVYTTILTPNVWALFLNKSIKLHKTAKQWECHPPPSLRTAYCIISSLRTALFWYWVLRTVELQKQPFRRFHLHIKRIKNTVCGMHRHNYSCKR